MKTIRQRITRPLIWSAILVPLAVLLVFNGIMRVYLTTAARDDLKTTTAVIETLVRDQLKDLQQENNGSLNQSALNTLSSIRSIVRSASRATGTDLLVIDRNGSIIFPKDTGQLGLTETALTRLKNQITDLTSGEVETLTTVSGQYFYQGFALRPANPEKSPWVICLASFDPTRGFLLITNLVLLGILLIGSLFGIMVTVRTARRISLPLKRLHQFADQVALGNFASDEPDRFCREVADLQRQMNAMAADLAQSDQLQKTFLQNASHELRTPLMAIQGYAEGLQSGVVTDVAKAAGIICDESRRLNRLVASLLTLSRIESQTGHVTLSPVNLNDWLLDQVQRAQGLVIGTDVTIRLVSPANIIIIKTDEELLGQAVGNILANAARFARQTVTVTCGRDAVSAWIAIADDGPGIAAVDLPHIFDRFYKGTRGQFGLGLAIASSAVAALHGELSARNAADGGAVFTIGISSVN